jgi:hypothetical protein
LYIFICTFMYNYINILYIIYYYIIIKSEMVRRYRPVPECSIPIGKTEWSPEWNLQVRLYHFFQRPASVRDCGLDHVVTQSPHQPPPGTECSVTQSTLVVSPRTGKRPRCTASHRPRACLFFFLVFLLCISKKKAPAYVLTRELSIFKKKKNTTTFSRSVLLQL